MGYTTAFRGHGRHEPYGQMGEDLWRSRDRACLTSPAVWAPVSTRACACPHMSLYMTSVCLDLRVRSCLSEDASPPRGSVCALCLYGSLLDVGLSRPLPWKNRWYSLRTTAALRGAGVYGQTFLPVPLRTGSSSSPPPPHFPCNQRHAEEKPRRRHS